MEKPMKRCTKMAISSGLETRLAPADIGFW